MIPYGTRVPVAVKLVAYCYTGIYFTLLIYLLSYGIAKSDRPACTGTQRRPVPRVGSASVAAAVHSL